MSARKEARDRKHFRESFDMEASKDPHAGCKREELRLRVDLCNAMEKAEWAGFFERELARTKEALSRSRAENEVMKEAFKLAKDRAKRLTKVEHRYGATIVLLTLKKHLW